MRVVEEKLVRNYSYFRLGFAKYLSYPLSIFQTITLAYLYVNERIPFLALRFYEFVILSVGIILPLGIFLGYFDMKKSNIYAIENIVAAECNPMSVHMNRLSMDALEQLFKLHSVELPEEWHRLHRYWIGLDKTEKWRPPE